MTLSLIGNPVKHSLSPRMHNLALKKLGYHGFYSRYLLFDGEKLACTFKQLKLNGANITVPFKEDAFRQCDEIQGIAKDIGSVNTIVKKDEKLIGYNTDAKGFILAIEDFLPLHSALVIGAGGTAKAISYALKEQGVRVSIVNRSAKRLDGFKKAGFECFVHDDFKFNSWDMIANTTSAGLEDGSLPLPKSLLEPILAQASYAFDVIYHKETAFLNECKKAKLSYKNGKDMLLYQGALALELFLQNKYDAKMLSKLMEESFTL